jgi:hypothetical protein
MIHSRIRWDMHPDPPWEEFRMLGFGTGEIDRVVVDTISIPEPFTFEICTLALILAFASPYRSGKVACR